MAWYAESGFHVHPTLQDGKYVGNTSGADAHVGHVLLRPTMDAHESKIDLVVRRISHKIEQMTARQIASNIRRPGYRSLHFPNQSTPVNGSRENERVQPSYDENAADKKNHTEDAIRFTYYLLI